jgi:hypothetical protein
MAVIQAATELRVLQMAGSTVALGGPSSLLLSLPKLRWLQLERVRCSEKRVSLQVRLLRDYVVQPAQGRA